MKRLKTISALPKKSWRGLRVILRLDLNVPQKNGRVVNDFRIKQTLPVLRRLSELGARVLVLSHLSERGASLRSVVRHLNKFIRVGFFTRLEQLPLVEELAYGGIVVLENLRLLGAGEDKNQVGFAKKLARAGDIFINDAFSVSHREHASVTSLPSLLPSLAGPLFLREFEELSKILRAKKPLMAILGGAKTSTKLPLIKRMLVQADSVFVGGALANTFLKAEGFTVGRSLVDKNISLIRPLLKNKKLVLPMDVVVKSNGRRVARRVEGVRPEETILDIGPKTLTLWRPRLAGAATILWNGPLGNFENGFSEATEKCAKAVARSRAHSVVGGGDTVAAIEKLGLLQKFGFVSTAGGAMLDFLTHGTLPGIEALRESQRKFKI